MKKLYLYEGTVWYKHDFKYDQRVNNRVFLYFEAVKYASRVHLNGELLGE